MINPVILISTSADGSMRSNKESSTSIININRQVFLGKNCIYPKIISCVKVDYDREDYCLYREASTQTDDQIADALITRSTDHLLILPLADCAGAVIFDSKQQILMLSHLGRHSIEQNGGYKSVNHLCVNYYSNPSDIQIWVSPSAGASNYPLYKFNNRSIKEVLIEQFIQAHVNPESISVNPADTTLDPNYFSHSEFLKGRRSIDGRFAIFAMINNCKDRIKKNP